MGKSWEAAVILDSIWWSSSPEPTKRTDQAPSEARGPVLGGLLTSPANLLPLNNRSGETRADIARKDRPPAGVGVLRVGQTF